VTFDAEEYRKMTGYVNVDRAIWPGEKSQLSFSTIDATAISRALGSCSATSLSIELIEGNKGLSVGSKAVANNS
jgi:hypothetical protein